MYYMSICWSIDVLVDLITTKVQNLMSLWKISGIDKLIVKNIDDFWLNGIDLLLLLK